MPTPTAAPTHLVFGWWYRGRSLDVSVVTLERESRVRYAAVDANGVTHHYHILPSSHDLELVLLRLKVENHTATSTIVNIDEQAAELRDFSQGKYFPIDITERAKEVYPPANPNEIRNILFLWNTTYEDGSSEAFDLRKSYGLDGWMIFEAPQDTQFSSFRWRAGDSLKIDFPSVGSTAIRAQTPLRSPTPVPNAIPTSTLLPTPTAVPTATPPAIGSVYFTRGSSQDDVIRTQGTPDKIHTYTALGYETWYYDRSTVTFSLPESRVREWDDKGYLKVRLLPKTIQSVTPGYFTRGSSQDDVIHAQGTPGEIHTYTALGYETWYYGRSAVTFSLPESRVREWDDKGYLKVRLLPKTIQSVTPGYFTRGSSQDDVIHAQGTPDEIHTYTALGYETWYYGRSAVTFSLPENRVREWDNEGDLKIR